jgi:hypothetical protein
MWIQEQNQTEVTTQTGAPGRMKHDLETGKNNITSVLYIIIIIMYFKVGIYE